MYYGWYNGLAMQRAVNRGWVNPYDLPLKQLANSYSESKHIISEIKE